MFADKLGLGRPQDISARMDLINSYGEIVYEKDKKTGQPLDAGWLEFWGPESEQVKRFGRFIAAEELLEEKRSAARGGRKGPTIAEMEKKVEGYERKAVEGLALRLKAWRLVSIDGEFVDIPPTKENAEQLFGNAEYGFLRQAALEFVGNPDNFFTRKPEALSSSPESSSEDT